MSSSLAFEWAPRVPPGAKDLPYDDGEPMETSRHFKQMTLLIQSLRRGWKDRHDFFVGGNMFMYFSEIQVRKNDFRGPDVFVVLDTTDEDRLSWVVWEEDGKTPAVVIELLSESTAAVDRGKKKQIYARQLHVPYYYLFHPFTHEFSGFELDPPSLTYRTLEPLPNGDLPCPVLGLSLGIREHDFDGAHARWLRWVGPDGTCLPTGDELADAAEKKADAAEKKADAAEKKADAAEKKADAAEVAMGEAETRAAQLAARLAEYEKKFGSI